MWRAAYAVVGLGLMSTAATAQSWNPFADIRGYQGPVRERNAPPAPRPSAQPLFGQQQTAGIIPFGTQPSKPAAVQFPAQMDGGPRPSISPVSPATVKFPNGYGAGSVVIDTNGRTLYYVLSSTQALRYPISVGRDGFQWTGVQSVSRKSAWPDWRPPAEMRQRQPGLPEVMTGGVRNPLGAMAIYLGSSLYRIHGTNDVSTIGQAASSGCFRMTNGHVMHLAGLVSVGAKVHVLRSLGSSSKIASSTGAKSKAY